MIKGHFTKNNQYADRGKINHEAGTNVTVETMNAYNTHIFFILCFKAARLWKKS